MAAFSCNGYTLESLEDSISGVAQSVKRNIGDGAKAWQPRIEARVWSREGLRSCLSLSAKMIRLVAGVSASLDFVPRQRVGREETGLGGEAVFSVDAQSPELVVLFIGDSPETGQESVISKVVCLQYRPEYVQASIAKSIALAQAKLKAETSLWHPQVGVRLSSDRRISPELALSADIIQRMGSCEASLDFDPYV